VLLLGLHWQHHSMHEWLALLCWLPACTRHAADALYAGLLQACALVLTWLLCLGARCPGSCVWEYKGTIALMCVFGRTCWCRGYDHGVSGGADWLAEASATAAAVAAVTVAGGPPGPSSVVRGVLAWCA
jgi:hypothetical protein